MRAILGGKGLNETGSFLFHVNSCDWILDPIWASPEGSVRRSTPKPDPSSAKDTSTFLFEMKPKVFNSLCDISMCLCVECRTRTLSSCNPPTPPGSCLKRSTGICPARTALTTCALRGSRISTSPQSKSRGQPPKTRQSRCDASTVFGFLKRGTWQLIAATPGGHIFLDGF